MWLIDCMLVYVVSGFIFVRFFLTRYEEKKKPKKNVAMKRRLISLYVPTYGRALVQKGL